MIQYILEAKAVHAVLILADGYHFLDKALTTSSLYPPYNQIIGFCLIACVYSFRRSILMGTKICFNLLLYSFFKLRTTTSRNTEVAILLFSNYLSLLYMLEV